MQLGLTSILVQEIVKHPDEEGETLGTTLVLTFASSILSVLGIVAFAFVAYISAMAYDLSKKFPKV